MYVSSTTSTVPHPYLEFAKQKSIPIIYLISLYNPSKRIQKFKFNSNNKWEPTTIECELKGVIGDKSIKEFESIYENSY
ncbi:hypothetical protein KM1_273560 [Entamoeba histolytica HM-3:IMSS]|nr:hypothetical protein KM1_273560 [Entamoeba histolytica HM-3:IMSS]